MGKYETAQRRFCAGFIDGMLFMPLGWVDAWVFLGDRPASLVVAWMLLSYPLFWLYSVLMHGFYGQTLGKRAAGVKVLDVSEATMTVRQAFLRDSIFIAINTAALVASVYIVASGMPKDSGLFYATNLALGLATLLWFLAEILTCLTNPKRRAVHDFIAGTVVVKTEYLAADVKGSNESFEPSAG